MKIRFWINKIENWHISRLNVLPLKHSIEDIQTESHSQNKAYQWLQQEDEEQTNITDSTNTPYKTSKAVSSSYSKRWL